MITSVALLCSCPCWSHHCCRPVDCSTQTALPLEPGFINKTIYGNKVGTGWGVGGSAIRRLQQSQNGLPTSDSQAVSNASCFDLQKPKVKESSTTYMLYKHCQLPCHGLTRKWVIILIPGISWPGLPRKWVRIVIPGISCRTSSSFSAAIVIALATSPSYHSNTSGLGFYIRETRIMNKSGSSVFTCLFCGMGVFVLLTACVTYAVTNH